jgi:hypothetical protein
MRFAPLNLASRPFSSCSEGKEVALEFRLIYEGPLHGQENPGRVQHKHAIRRHFHPQLRQLWERHDFLKRNLDYFAGRYERDGFRYVPLVNSQQGRFCALDLLVLWRNTPGNIVRAGGDIDNRIKVLFDALRMTTHKRELDGAAPQADEDPFFCLLEDDRLITDFRVTTDYLLKPIPSSGTVDDVVVLIAVRTGSIDLDDRD